MSQVNWVKRPHTIFTSMDCVGHFNASNIKSFSRPFPDMMHNLLRVRELVQASLVPLHKLATLTINAVWLQDWTSFPESIQTSDRILCHYLRTVLK